MLVQAKELGPKLGIHRVCAQLLIHLPTESGPLTVIVAVTPTLTTCMTVTSSAQLYGEVLWTTLEVLQDTL